jgi:hypothetical protein
MSKRDPFESPKLKVLRAKKHLADYISAFKALDNTDFARFYVAKNSSTGQFELRVKKLDPLPSEMHLTAADALYNLRSGLDQALSQCAVLAGNSSKNTYFPHGKDEPSFKASLGEKCKQVPRGIRALVTGIAPYYSGRGHLIRALHDLNLVDKHNNLLHFNLVLQDLVFSPPIADEVLGLVSPSSNKSRKGTRVGLPIEGKRQTYGREHTIRNADEEVRFSLSVAFTGVEAVKKEPVTVILRDMCDLCERVVSELEAECKKLGLL